MFKNFIIISFILLANVAFSQKTDSLASFKPKKGKFSYTMSEVFGARPLMEVDRPKVAFIRSMLVPGWGQITNKQYFLLPIIYTAAIGGYYFGIRNNNLKYHNYRDALLKSIALGKGNVYLPDQTKLKSNNGYLSIYEPNAFFKKSDLRQFYALDSKGNYYTLEIDNEKSKEGDVVFDAKLATSINNGDIIGPFSQTTFASTTANYRRYRDMSIVFMALGWTIFAVQANVQAHLNHFDLSEDISMKISPSINSFPSNGSIGASITLNFK